MADPTFDDLLRFAEDLFPNASEEELAEIVSGALELAKGRVGPGPTPEAVPSASITLLNRFNTASATLTEEGQSLTEPFLGEDDHKREAELQVGQVVNRLHEDVQKEVKFAALWDTFKATAFTSEQRVESQRQRSLPRHEFEDEPLFTLENFANWLAESNEWREISAKSEDYFAYQQFVEQQAGGNLTAKANLEKLRDNLVGAASGLGMSFEEFTQSDRFQPEWDNIVETAPFASGLRKQISEAEEERFDRFKEYFNERYVDPMIEELGQFPSDARAAELNGRIEVVQAVLVSADENSLFGQYLKSGIASPAEFDLGNPAVGEMLSFGRAAPSLLTGPFGPLYGQQLSEKDQDLIATYNEQVLDPIANEIMMAIASGADDDELRALRIRQTTLGGTQAGQAVMAYWRQRQQETNGAITPDDFLNDPRLQGIFSGQTTILDEDLRAFAPVVTEFALADRSQERKEAEERVRQQVETFQDTFRQAYINPLLERANAEQDLDERRKAFDLANSVSRSMTGVQARFEEAIAAKPTITAVQFFSQNPDLARVLRGEAVQGVVEGVEGIQAVISGQALQAKLDTEEEAEAEEQFRNILREAGLSEEDIPAIDARVEQFGETRGEAAAFILSQRLQDARIERDFGGIFTPEEIAQARQDILKTGEDLEGHLNDLLDDRQQAARINEEFGAVFTPQEIATLQAEADELGVDRAQYIRNKQREQRELVANRTQLANAGVQTDAAGNVLRIGQPDFLRRQDEDRARVFAGNVLPRFGVGSLEGLSERVQDFARGQVDPDDPLGLSPLGEILGAGSKLPRIAQEFGLTAEELVQLASEGGINPATGERIVGATRPQDVQWNLLSILQQSEDEALRLEGEDQAIFDALGAAGIDIGSFSPEDDVVVEEARRRFDLNPSAFGGRFDPGRVLVQARRRRVQREGGDLPTTTANQPVGAKTGDPLAFFQQSDEEIAAATERRLRRQAEFKDLSSDELRRVQASAFDSDFRNRREQESLALAALGARRAPFVPVPQPPSQEHMGRLPLRISRR